MKSRSTAVLLVALLGIGARPVLANQPNVHPSGSVVLLHGLARTADSMAKMNRALEAAGYHVCNVSYPSRAHSIEVLSKEFVLPAVRSCLKNPTDEVHFVTHSLGGIVVRQLAKSAPDLSIGRVVMLSPPNHGSEVVDKLGELASSPDPTTARSRSRARSWKGWRDSAWCRPVTRSS